MEGTMLNGVLGLYALLNVGLGILGMVQKGSVPSLVAGTAAGLVILAGVFWARTRPALGYGLCALVCVGIIARFMGPVLGEQQVYPAGVMVVASAATLAVLAFSHFAQKPVGR
jgi:uncharacterized membrane protein (UPF0136 family)